MNEELELLKEVAARLEAAGIEYMMTGSMALAVYSTPRMTRDIDIIIEATPADADRIAAMFRTDFYLDEPSVREAIRNKSIFNIIHNDSVVKIDFIVRKDGEYRLTEFSRRRIIDLDGVPVSVVAPEDLVLSKLVWAQQSDSELQFRDACQVMKSVPGLDNEYMLKWACILGCMDIFQKAKG